MTAEVAYILIDGENIDMTLGGILNARPQPQERPRWERVVRYVEERWKKGPKTLFFLNASRGMPMSFIAALRASGIQPIPLTGTSEQKVVDLGILRTLEAIENRPGDVMLVSHDRDFAPAMARLAAMGRKVGVMAFDEHVAQDLREIPGLEIHDLEYNVNVFEGAALPRIRAIPIDEFDPRAYL